MLLYLPIMKKLAAVLTDKADLGVHINEKPNPPAMLGRME